MLIGAAACSPVPVAPTQWLHASPPMRRCRRPRRPAPRPRAAAASGTASGTASGATSEVWQLVLPVLPESSSAMRSSCRRRHTQRRRRRRAALAGARWIEPLRDAVPRVLREDLSRELRRRTGALVLWRSPLPPGLVPTRQLRVEITAFEIGPARAVVTNARWSIADVRGERPPRVHEARFDTAPASMPADAAPGRRHTRQAIAVLAARIAATMAAASS
ncbi:MAG: ABC-type transport auxiliary lipoprotein family protein [Rubrivivax sp.]